MMTPACDRSLPGWIPLALIVSLIVVQTNGVDLKSKDTIPLNVAHPSQNEIHEVVPSPIREDDEQPEFEADSYNGELAIESIPHIRVRRNMMMGRGAGGGSQSNGQKNSRGGGNTWHGRNTGRRNWSQKVNGVPLHHMKVSIKKINEPMASPALMKLFPHLFQ